MLYTGQFRSIHKNNLYTIQIVTGGASGGTPVDVSLGPEPFVTNMDSGSSTIYSPVKYQSATVQLVSKEYYFDMYSKTPKENTVVLKDASSNNKVVFTGYISPNVYDADYNFITETWDVECTDGLSVLKNYDYVPANGTAKDFIPFNILIHNCLFQCGCYKKFYMSKALAHSTASKRTSSIRAIEKLTISEQNFFDEDNEPMKYSEVLEECCKFLGVVCVADGEDVYFMDLDAIKAGYNKYDVYTIGTAKKATTASYVPTNNSSNRNVTIDSSLTIGPDSYSSTGSRISMESVYSKVTVKDSLYPVKSIIPSLYEDEDLRNVHYKSETDQEWGFGDSKTCFHGGESSKKTDDDTYFNWKWRYYTNKNYIHNFYDNSTGHVIYSWDLDSNPDASSGMIPIQSPLTAATALGAVITKYAIGSGKTSAAAYANLEYDSWDNYLMLTANHSVASGRAPDGSRGLALIQAREEFSKPFFMSGKTKLIAKGEVILVDKLKFPKTTPNDHSDASIGYWPHTGVFTSAYNGNWWKGNTLMISQNLVALKTKVDIGSNITKTVDIPFYPQGEGTKELKENSKTHDIFYTTFGVQDSVTWSDKIKEKGFKIDMQMNQDLVVGAKTKISLYGMDNLRVLFNGFDYTTFPSPLGCIFIKDFDIVAVDPYEGPDDGVTGTDTEYSVEINDEFTTELSPIEFKFCTADGKSLNYSTVAWKDSSTAYSYVDTLYHAALSDKLVPAGALSQYVRSEELMCFKLVNQYSEPCKKLSINLFNDLIKPYTLVTDPAYAPDGTTKLLNCQFIVDTFSNNYAMDTITCNLVEKR